MKIPLPSKPFQIVTLRNNRPLFPKILLQEILDRSFSTTNEYSESDKASVDIEIQEQQLYYQPKLLSPKKYKKSLYSQKIGIHLVSEKIKNPFWKLDINKRLYLKFINYKERLALETFILQINFTIFPTIKELRLLWKKYTDKKIDKLLELETEFSEIQIRENYIQQINIDFIMKKQKELKRIVHSYYQGTFTYEDLHWLNRELEGVAYMLIDKDCFPFKEIKKQMHGKKLSSKKPLSKIIKNISLSETELRPIARVYGHFSYCCYEFLLDILENEKIRWQQS